MKKKKSLGQHFLRSANYLNLIADTANIRANELVLEVGPGEGALTEQLLQRGARVIAIEKDNRLIPVLVEKFKKNIESRNLYLHEGDVLICEPADIAKTKENYKIVANIPYYITGVFIRKFLTAHAQPSLMVILVQKEVAERIARNKKESLLSLSVKVYGNPNYIKTVPRGAFSPAPAVDSAILSIADISRKNFSSFEHEEKFFKLIHAGFAQKRKLLKRNVETVLGPKAGAKLIEVGIDENARAEDVPLSNWLALAKV